MIIFLMLVLGAAMGSFTGALVWRIYQVEHTKSKKLKERLSMAKGRSMCEHCKHELSSSDLIPIISYLILRGKCRYCSKKISWQAPAMEIGLAIAFAASYIWWPHGFDAHGTLLFTLWLAAQVGLLAIFVYDLRWMLIPNKIIYPMIIFALIYVFVDAAFLSSDAGPIKDAVLGLLVGGGIFFALFQASSGKWIGGGDVKLGIFLGLILGPAASFGMIFLASVLGSIVTLYLMGIKKVGKNQQIPFGPYLILAGWAMFVFGQKIIDWYTDLFLVGI